MENQFLLHKLVFRNDHVALEQALKEIPPDKIESELSVKFRLLPVLHLAIQLGHSECITMLLKYGADPLSRNGLGFHALHEALSIGERKVVEQILSAQKSFILAIVKQHQERTSKTVVLGEKSFYVEIELNCSCSSNII